MYNSEGTVWIVFYIPNTFSPSRKVLESVHKSLGSARKFKNKLAKERDTWQNPWAAFKITKIPIKE